MKTKNFIIYSSVFIIFSIFIYLIINETYLKTCESKIEDPVYDDNVKYIIEDILKYNLYINLEHRKDRKEQVEKELKNFGIKSPKRLNAIKNKKGALGCCRSHIKALNTAIEKDYPHILIFEDDVMFLTPKDTYDKLDRVLKSNLNWDVIILGGYNKRPHKNINEDVVRVNNCQCANAYLLKKEYYKTLLENFKESEENLNKNKKENIYAIDQNWKKLQKKDNWYLLKNSKVVQRPSFSDIENKNVNYINLMS